MKTAWSCTLCLAAAAVLLPAARSDATAGQPDTTASQPNTPVESDPLADALDVFLKNDVSLQAFGDQCIERVGAAVRSLCR